MEIRILGPPSARYTNKFKHFRSTIPCLPATGTCRVTCSPLSPPWMRVLPAPSNRNGRGASITVSSGNNEAPPTAGIWQPMSARTKAFRSCSFRSAEKLHQALKDKFTAPMFMFAGQSNRLTLLDSEIREIQYTHECFGIHCVRCLGYLDPPYNRGLSVTLGVSRKSAILPTKSL